MQLVYFPASIFPNEWIRQIMLSNEGWGAEGQTSLLRRVDSEKIRFFNPDLKMEFSH